MTGVQLVRPGAAHLRDRLAVVRARGVVVDQRGRVLLPALVPGPRVLQRQAAHHSGHQRGLDALDEEILTVGVVEEIADHPGVEELDLHVIPVLAVHGAVPLQAVVEEFRLPADLVVGQLVR